MRKRQRKIEITPSDLNQAMIKFTRLITQIIEYIENIEYHQKI